ncbi:MAG: lysophospholipid acyltransferase family protein [Bacteroidota bacterium]
MKDLGYGLVKLWIKNALALYFSRIHVHGLENVPKNKPVLFLPNHQSALLDVLLIAVDCNRKPYFLTRADVFKKPWLKALFRFLQMIPIYRIRDGRQSLKNNDAVFRQCADLLEGHEAILMFPEANHNLKRRVRPLSKGFTRIVFAAMEQNPDLDIRLVPVGLNYRYAEAFPDRTAIYFGQDIPVKPLYAAGDARASIDTLKHEVSQALKGLTTHVEDEGNYMEILAKLDGSGANYLKPLGVNAQIADLESGPVPSERAKGPFVIHQLLYPLFFVLNFPVILLWKKGLKPKVWEPEFTATLRFALALLVYPLFYLVLFGILGFVLDWPSAGAVVLGIFLFNLLYVRLG